jgi:hypothetical protein
LIVKIIVLHCHVFLLSPSPFSCLYVIISEVFYPIKLWRFQETTSYIANWNLKTGLASFRFCLVISARLKTTPSPNDICFLQIREQGTKKRSADSTNRNNDCLLKTHPPNITNMLSTTNWVSGRLESDF